MISTCRFEPEIDLLTCGNIRECLRNCGLIGPYDDYQSLEEHTNMLMRRFIEEKIPYFPNSKKELDFWIIEANDLLCSTTVEGKLSTSEMTRVQLCFLIASTEIEIVYHAKKIRNNAIDVCWKQVREISNILSIPTK